MGVYIKGQTMPETCNDCEFLDLDTFDYEMHTACGFTGEIVTYDLRHGRNKNCPLIEVAEPHGRLIDADKIDAYKLPIEKQESSEWHKHSAVYKYAAPVFNGALDMVKDHAPTVIEAEYTVIEAEGES